MIPRRANPRIALLGLGIAAATLVSAPPGVADFDLMSAVGVWHMDEGEGAVTNDSSPSGNHAELWRDPVWVDDRFGKALEFDGQSFLWIKDAVGIPLGASPRTVMCHFKWAEVNDWADAVSPVSDAEALISLGRSGWHGRVTLGFYMDGGPGVDTTPARNLFEWEADTD